MASIEFDLVRWCPCKNCWLTNGCTVAVARLLKCSVTNKFALCCPSRRNQGLGRWSSSSNRSMGSFRNRTLGSIVLPGVLLVLQFQIEDPGGSRGFQPPERWRIYVAFRPGLSSVFQELSEIQL